MLLVNNMNNRVNEYNDWSALKAVLDKSDLVFIFGAFIRGLHVMHHLEGHGYNVSFIDNDKNKQEGGYEDYEVNSVEFAIENSSENTVYLIPDNRHKQEMRKSLQELGIKYEKIIDVFKTLIPYKSLSLEVQIVEHCNLGCQNCNHFSPLAEKEFVSVEELKKDFQRISKLCEEQPLKRLYLLGGGATFAPKIRSNLRY